MGPGMREMARWKKIVFGVAVALLLFTGAALAWWSANGRDFVWSKVRPGHAALLAGQEIPDELSPEDWAEDLAFLARELPRRFVRFDQAVDRAAFEAEVAALEPRLAGLSRERAAVELMGIAALPGPGTGHTGIPPFQRPLDWGFYPLYAWLFDDGVWITLAGGGAEEALGAEVLAVGGQPVGEVLERAAPFLPADNDVGRKALLGAALSFPEMLQALGVAGDDGAVELTLRRSGGEPFPVRVEPVRLASFAGLRWGQALQEPVDSASPADPRPRARAHWFEYRPEHRLLYLQLNEVRDAEGQTLAELAERLGRAVGEHEVEKLVIDLRANGGGNNQLVEPLVELLSGHPELDRRGVLYTLIGRRTYSAAGNLASALEHRTETLFAGEPTGSAPNHYGDAVDLLLPRSKIVVQISTRYWEDGGPYDRRRWIAPSAPELAVRSTHADHAAGRDPVLEAVLAHRPEPVVAAPLEAAVASELVGRYRFDPFRVLAVEEAPDGGLRMEIRGAVPFASSDLHPVPSSGTRLATALPGVFLQPAAATDGLGLDWRGVVETLPRVREDFRLPIELLRGGRLEEGIAAYRSLAADGHLPDSRTEMELNRIGYDLLGEGEADAAVEVFRLQTELYPEVANSFDSLGDGYRRTGEPERAAQAYRRALEIDPGFRHSRRMLEELDASGR